MLRQKDAITRTFFSNRARCDSKVGGGLKIAILRFVCSADSYKFHAANAG